MSCFAPSAVTNTGGRCRLSNHTTKTRRTGLLRSDRTPASILQRESRFFRSLEALDRGIERVPRIQEQDVVAALEEAGLHARDRLVSRPVQDLINRIEPRERAECRPC